MTLTRLQLKCNTFINVIMSDIKHVPWWRHIRKTNNEVIVYEFDMQPTIRVTYRIVSIDTYFIIACISSAEAFRVIGQLE